jgi:hypothetical protein
MSTDKNTSREDVLYTDERGEIECEEHAPPPMSDTWWLDRWRAITKSEAAEFEREIGRAPRCETCAAIELREEENAR